MYKSTTKCNETLGKWCKNKHGASKIIDTFETYHGALGLLARVPAPPSAGVLHADEASWLPLHAVPGQVRDAGIATGFWQRSTSARR
jgi:hypothetical protein